LPEAYTNPITNLLADAYPFAIEFYDQLGLKGSEYPWKLYRKSSIDNGAWEEKVPKWYDCKISEYRGEKVFEAKGNEFRYFEDPSEVLARIIEDTIDKSPACRYMPEVNVSRIEPMVKRRRMVSGGESSTHVIWNIYTEGQERPIAQTKQVIFATGADFVKPESPTRVPELEYIWDAMHISRGSVLDLVASSPFPSHISQQNVVLSPLSREMFETPETSETSLETDSGAEAPKEFYGRLGSTQRVTESELEEKAEALLAQAKHFFPDLPSDARIAGLRSGERLYRANRIPIVGGLVDPVGTHKLYPTAVHGAAIPPSSPRLSGLYYLGGLGSRGFTLAPLLSHMLVEQMCGPFNVKSTFLPATMNGFMKHWWIQMSPRRALSRWLRQRPNIPTHPHWAVNWPSLVGHKSHFPADYTEASQSFDTIPTSWNPNRAQFESTYCPLFDDDHTRD
jgi:hypothetical protein